VRGQNSSWRRGATAPGRNSASAAGAGWAPRRQGNTSLKPPRRVKAPNWGRLVRAMRPSSPPAASRRDPVGGSPRENEISLQKKTCIFNGVAVCLLLCALLADLVFAKGMPGARPPAPWRPRLLVLSRPGALPSRCKRQREGKKTPSRKRRLLRAATAIRL